MSSTKGKSLGMYYPSALMDSAAPTTVIRAVNIIEEVLERVDPTDWHDEFHTRVEETSNLRDCLELVAKILRETHGWNRKVATLQKLIDEKDEGVG